MGFEVFADDRLPRGAEPVALGGLHLQQLFAAIENLAEFLQFGGGSGRTSGCNASPKWASVAASSVSVLARRPVALAKSRTCRGLTMATDSRRP